MDDGGEGWGQKEWGWQGVSLAFYFRRSRLHSRKGDPCDQQRSKSHPKVLKVAERNSRVRPVMLEKGDEKNKAHSWVPSLEFSGCHKRLALSVFECWVILFTDLAGRVRARTHASESTAGGLVTAWICCCLQLFRNSRESLGLEKKWLRKSDYMLTALWASGNTCEPWRFICNPW